jgi:hypothetical protein
MSKRATKSKDLKSKKGGRPFHVWPDDAGATVSILVGMGYDLELICALFPTKKGTPVSVKTLQRKFKMEIQAARAQMDKAVLMAYTRRILDPDAPPAYMLNYLKQRMWRPERGGHRDPPSQHAVLVHPTTGERLTPAADGPPRITNLNVSFVDPDPAQIPDFAADAVARPVNVNDPVNAGSVNIDAKPRGVNTYDAGASVDHAGRSNNGYSNNPVHSVTRPDGRTVTVPPKRVRPVFSTDPAEPSHSDRPPGGGGYGFPK